MLCTFFRIKSKHFILITRTTLTHPPCPSGPVSDTAVCLSHIAYSNSLVKPGSLSTPCLPHATPVISHSLSYSASLLLYILQKQTQISFISKRNMISSPTGLCSKTFHCTPTVCRLYLHPNSLHTILYCSTSTYLTLAIS